MDGSGIIILFCDGGSVLIVFNLKFQLWRCNRHQDPATYIGAHHEVVMAQSSKLSFQSPADRLQFRGLR
jgi:hypothetical protein